MRDVIAPVLGVDPVPALFLAVFVLIGVALVVYGLANLRTYLTLKSTTTTDAHAVGSGFVEIEGEATPARETLEAPFSGVQCLGYEFEVEEYRHDDDGSNWHTRASGDRVVPFTIRDETGAVGVQPTGENLSVERNYRTVVGPDDRPPERVQAFLDAQDDLDHDTAMFDVAGISVGGDKLRFTERRLDAGETAYAAGRADATTAVDGETPTVVDDGAGVLDDLVGQPFVVADAGEGEAEWRHLKVGVGSVLFGLVFAGFPLFVLWRSVLA